MKKYYLFLMAMLLSLGNLSADEWKVTGSDTWSPALPSTATASEVEYKNNDGKKITIYNVKKQVNSGVTAFLLTASTGYLTTEEIPGKITNITLKTSSQCSTSAQVDVYIGENAVESSYSLNERSKEFNITVSIDNNYSPVKIEAGSKNVQLDEITITYEPAVKEQLAQPVINLDGANSQFTISEVTGGTIMYTVNQSEEATAADCTTEYTGTAVPYKTEVGTYYVHAYAKANDTSVNTDSGVTTVSYTVDNGPKPLASPTITLDDEKQQFTIDAVEGGTVYYVVNQNVTATAADCITEYSGAVSYGKTDGTYYVHAYARTSNAEEHKDSDVATRDFTVARALVSPTITLDDEQQQFTIDAVEGGTVYYIVNENPEATADECTEQYTGAVAYSNQYGDHYIHACAKPTNEVKNDPSAVATEKYNIPDAKAVKTYKIATPTSLKAGDQFLLVYITTGDTSTGNTMGEYNSSKYYYDVYPVNNITGTGTERKIEIKESEATQPSVITLEASGDSEYPYYLKVGGEYLYATNSNVVKKSPTIEGTNTYKAKISANSSDANNATITFPESTENRYLQYNSNESQKRFVCYKSTSNMHDCLVFKYEPEESSPDLTFTHNAREVDGEIYARDGEQIEVKMTVSGYDAAANLHAMWTDNGYHPNLADGNGTKVELGTEREHTFTIPAEKKLMVEVAQVAEDGTSYSGNKTGFIKLNYTPIVNQTSEANPISNLANVPEGSVVEETISLLPYARVGTVMYLTDVESDAENTPRHFVKLTGAPYTGEIGIELKVSKLLCRVESGTAGTESYKYLTHISSEYDTTEKPNVQPSTMAFSSFEATAENLYRFVKFENVYVTDGKISSSAPTQQSGPRKAAGDALALNDTFKLTEGQTTTGPTTVIGMLEYSNGAYGFIPTTVGDVTVSIEEIDSNDAAAVEAVYTLQGVRVPAAILNGRSAKGIYIVRYSDGRTSKRIVR